MTNDPIHDIAQTTDAFEVEITRSFLESTVREMRLSTARSAYSTCFAEGEDFTCGLVDAKGRLIVQAGLPGHMGTIVDSMTAVRNAYAEFAPGDVILHNDPFNLGSHQADVLVVRPIFHDDQLLAFAVNRGHWIDVGGSAAGGWDGSTSHAVQEGLVIPPTKLYEAGRLREDVRDFILKNVRMPRFVWGDLQAQVASAVVAQRRLEEIIAKRGADHVLSVMQQAQMYSRRHFLNNLKSLPQGSSVAEDFMEDDGRGGGPYRVRVEVKLTHEGVTVDFTGTAPQVMAPINSTITNTRAASYAAVIAVVDPDVPVSSGCLDLIDVVVPEGTILNATWPAPIYTGTADPNNRAAETVLRALANIAPERCVAGSYATGNNSVGSGIDEHGQFLWYIFESGGLGARQDFDGNNAEWHLLPNCKNESMEVWESRFPVVFEQYRLLADSGGAGRRRGGLGTERSLRVTRETYVHAVADRHQIPPWPLEGGEPGRCNEIRVVKDGEELRPTQLGAESDSKFSDLVLNPDDCYIVRQGGGGGFGNPLEREIERVVSDVEFGYVTPEAARSQYGVAVEQGDQGWVVDEETTSSLRGTAS